MISDDRFLEKVLFSDEATFHVSGAVNRRNVRIWGSENPHAYVEHQRDSPKVKVFCAPMLTRVWQELEYHIDVCRVTRGAHIEHL
jgi:hypothetical protein